MKYKICALLCVLAMVLSMTGCGEETQTTITGIVTAVDGTVITLQQFDAEMTEGSFEEFGGGRGSDRGEFDGTMPKGMERPEMPEDGTMPEMPEDGTMPEMPEGMEMPEMPEGMERPEMPTGEDGQLAELPTGEGGRMQNFGTQGESTTVDLANAHISVEIEDGKATGSMEDITVGTFLTITLNEKGEAVNVVVSVSSGFSRRPSEDAN